MNPLVDQQLRHDLDDTRHLIDRAKQPETDDEPARPSCSRTWSSRRRSGWRRSREPTSRGSGDDSVRAAGPSGPGGAALAGDGA